MVDSASEFLKTTAHPESVENLGIIMQEKENVKTDEQVNHILKKLGYMMLAKDCLTKPNVTHIPSIWHDFIFNNFVYDTKAFLDSVAVVLNELLLLDAKSSDIDLGKESFLNKISAKNETLANNIRSQKKWIKDVVMWRTNLIHRLTTVVIPKYPGDPEEFGRDRQDHQGDR